jgi:hypothetical protein
MTYEVEGEIRLATEETHALGQIKEGSKRRMIAGVDTMKAKSGCH